MSETKRARPLGPDDSGVDHFVFVTEVSYGRREPRMYPIHSGFFGCRLGYDEKPRQVGSGPFAPVAVTKNVYNLTPIFLMGVSLVVNRTVRDLLAPICTIDFREVVIERAFWFPYAPGDDSFKLAGINLEGREADVIERFANVYQCPPPQERYYNVIVHISAFLQGKYDDSRVLHVGRDSPPGFGIYGRDAVVSPRMIKEHGLVFAGDYACRPDVFEILNPYLHRPWFWTQRYAYD